MFMKLIAEKYAKIIFFCFKCKGVKDLEDISLRLGMTKMLNSI